MLACMVVAMQPAAAQRASCTISTDKARTVQIRVGPGTNRSVYTFLPANQAFAVLGQAEAADGGLWWKLERTEVAPNSLANEAWVTQDEVETAGNCDGVSDAVPPPLIPFDASPLAKLIAEANRALCPGASSEVIAAQSWTADLATTTACIANLLEWRSEAGEQQAARAAAGICDVLPQPGDLEPYFEANWALTDIATGYFNLGLRLKAAGDAELAKAAFDMILTNYSCAYAWDPKGWFWSLATGAREQS
jgi:hypothetical protein